MHDRWLRFIMTLQAILLGIGFAGVIVLAYVAHHFLMKVW